MLKAIVYKEQNKVAQSTIPAPELTGNGAIIKVKGCGLCGSDIVKLQQGLVKEGTVLGHEVVGIIEKINGDWDFKVGDRVALGHHVPCFECVYCKNENYSMCAGFKSSNIIPGGFAEYIYASEKHLANTVFKVPEGLSDTEASFMEPLACCLRAIKRAGVKKDDRVLVIGLGSIGLLMGQAIKNAGAEAIGCDLIPERLALAEKLGISTKQGKDYDRVFLTAGSASTLKTAISSVRDGGTILVFASVPQYEAGFSNNDIYYRELIVLGSYSPAPDDLKTALKLISKKIIKVDNLFNVYGMIDIEKAISDTLSNSIIKAYISVS